MPFRLTLRLRIVGATLLALCTIAAMTLAYAPSHPASASSSKLNSPFCTLRAALCTETQQPWDATGTYTGHDEPSVLFYSNKAGSGNSNVYQLTLPTDPPTQPQQNGKGSTWNFQLHPAFWFGMAMCDTQSAPNPGNVTWCAPDSDKNIFDDPNKSASDYIGNHPGTAFMEMQFYPPGWVPWPAGNSCDPTKWCAALNIDSLTENMVTGQMNNAACLSTVGPEPVNFAFITLSGKSQAPANPVDSTLATFTPDPKQDLFMGSGDKLTVELRDTEHGLLVKINDRTTHQVGSMTASAANGFGQVKWDPTGNTCTNIPYDFHPMYSTSSERTRVVWAAHSYNVAFADEIGHFEYCPAVNPVKGTCIAPSATDPSGPDSDDSACFTPAQSSRAQIGGCIATDGDFDGVPYQATAWPGGVKGDDRPPTPSPILFSSPLFASANGQHLNYDRIAFEADLPRIEDQSVSPNNNCNRTTGTGCVNPPVGANFYPFFSIRGGEGGCLWQLGGAYIPGSRNTFGGSSTAEYGGLLSLVYPTKNAQGYITRYNDFRRVLSENPCEVNGSGGGQQ